jgi:hypothetical protein
LQIETFRHGRAEIGRVLKAAAARGAGVIDVLLNVVPFDVVNARGNSQAIVEVVLRTDLEALGRIRLVVGRRAAALGRRQR